MANFFKRLLAKTIKPIPRVETASAGKIQAVSAVPVVARLAEFTMPAAGAVVATGSGEDEAEGDVVGEGLGEGLGATCHCANSVMSEANE